MENPQVSDPERPVAYDANGQPLFAHPSAAQPAPVQPPVAVVHMTRPLTPVAQEIPLEVAERHRRSVERYPQLDLSEHEYVVLSVHRNLIGLLLPILVVFFAVSVVAAGMVLLPEILQSIQPPVSVSYSTLLLIGTCLIALLLTGLYIIYWVYVSNTFFLTNESIVEKTQLTPFSSNVKSVGLGDVVDVSYKQSGIIEQLFNYGIVQVGTKDDEVPYVFSFVSSPQRQASILKDAVEAFKNGRPYGGDGSESADK